MSELRTDVGTLRTDVAALRADMDTGLGELGEAVAVTVTRTPPLVRWPPAPDAVRGRARFGRLGDPRVSYRSDSLTKNTPPDADSSPMDVRPMMPLPKNG